MRKTILTLGVAGLALSVAAPAQAAQEPIPVTVMARNLYLGADVGKALELLPDLEAAGEFMWEEVQATDFKARAPSWPQKPWSTGRR